MKRFFGLLLIWGLSLGARGQVAHLGEVVFPNMPGLIWHEMVDFRYFVEGPFHLCAYEGLSTRYCVVLNTETGIATNASFIPRQEYNFGTSKLYRGLRITQTGSTQIAYARLLDDGTFLILSLPAAPMAFYNGKGYTVTNSELFEIELNPFEVKSLHVFETQIDRNSTELFVSADTAYMAHRSGYSTFSFADTVFSQPFEAYFETFDLRLIPQTGIRGKYLYADRGGENEVHEVGGQFTARLIPTIDEIPNEPFGYAYQQMILHTSDPGLEVVNGADRTWINLLTRIDEAWDQQDHLVEVNRSETTPGITVLQTFKRGKNQDYRRAALSLVDDSRLVALGLFGEEGFEPYGMVDGAFALLKDLYPGKAGSVDYLIDATSSNRNNPGHFAEAHGRFWFTGSVPGFGREICLSDGTPDGTHVLADLQPGLKGIRRARFAVDGGMLYAFVQHHNYTTAVYQIGPQIPPPPTPEEMEVAWESFTAPIIEDAFLYENLDVRNEPQISHSTDGYLYQLLDGVRLGRLVSDSLSAGQYNFSLGGWSTERILRLDKIDPATGDRVWRKPFLTQHGTSWSAIKMLADQSGKPRVISIGPGSYADFDNQVTSDHPATVESRYVANLITFGSNGDFEGLVRINYEERLHDLLHFSETADGDFISVVASDTPMRLLRLLKFDASGEVMTVHNSGFSGRDQIRCWRDDGGLLWVSSHPKDLDCDHCQAELRAYNEELVQVQQHAFRYSGSIMHPNVHEMPNGEKWYTGAFDGSLVFDGGGPHQLVEADLSGTLQPFVIRVLINPQYFLDAILIDVEALGYTPSFVREGNVFLSYIEDGHLDIPPSNENIYGTHTNPQMRELNQVVVQLDGVGVSYGSFTQTMWSQNRWSFRDVAMHHGWLPSGLWWQHLMHNHMAWHSPEPEYNRGFLKGAQLAAMPWPFTPVAIPLIATTADERDSHMHIFPNPTNSGGFYIVPRDGNKIPYSRFHIHDLHGRLVYESLLQDFFNAQEVRLPQHLHAGVYHVVFTGDELRESHRLVLVK